MEDNIESLGAMRGKFRINDYVKYIGESSRTDSSKEPRFAKIIKCPKDNDTYFCLELVENGVLFSTIMNNIRVIETTEKYLLKSNLFAKEEKVENGVVVFYFKPFSNIYYSPAFGFYCAYDKTTVEPDSERKKFTEFDTKNTSLYNINDVIALMAENSEFCSSEIFKKLCL